MKKKVLGLFFSSMVAFSCGQENSPKSGDSHVQPPFEGMKVVVIGDSISDGMLSHTFLNSQESLNKVKQQFFEIYDIPTKTIKKDKAIEKFAYHENSVFHEKNKQKWSLLSMVEQELVQKKVQRKLQWRSSLVQTGAEFKDMSLKLESLKSKESIDILMIQLASNDYCNKDLTLEKFSQNVEAFLEKASLKYEYKYVVYAGFPHIPGLFNDKKFSPDLLEDSVLDYIDFKISDYRFSLCPIMKDLSLEKSQERWNDFEKILKEKWQKIPQGKWISLNQLNLEPEDIALDGFHPSQKGQEKWGKIVFEELKNIL